MVRTPQQVIKHLPGRFWSKVDKTRGEDACWLWLGALNPNDGYAQFSFNSENIHASRIAWLLSHGEMPELYICHHCDNPRCVNPKHLYEGTPLDNAQDRERRGRGNPPTGKRNHNTKLNEDDVREIKRTFKSLSYGDVTAMSRKYGVCRNTLYAIRDEITWRYIDV